MKTAARQTTKTAPRRAAVQIDDHASPLVLRLKPAIELTERQFFELCVLNRDLRIERNSSGELEIMPPAGWESSTGNAQVIWRLVGWSNSDGTGIVSDSSGGYRLPNGAVRAPDAGWMLRDRLAQIPAAQRKEFIPACPDFVIEPRSPSDRLSELQAKMREYLANGVRLGWLLDPRTHTAYIYRPGAPVERLKQPTSLAGDPVLPGFVLDLSTVW